MNAGTGPFRGRFRPGSHLTMVDGASITPLHIAGPAVDPGSDRGSRRGFSGVTLESESFLVFGRGGPQACLGERFWWHASDGASGVPGRESDTSEG